MDINSERKFDRQLIEAQDSLLRDATFKLGKIQKLIDERRKLNEEDPSWGWSYVSINELERIIVDSKQ